jgi:hypothetical protein
VQNREGKVPLAGFGSFFSTARKSRKINLSLAASGMILQNHRRLHVSIFSVKIAAKVFEAGYQKDFQN